MHIGLCPPPIPLKYAGKGLSHRSTPKFAMHQASYMEEASSQSRVGIRPRRQKRRNAPPARIRASRTVLYFSRKAAIFFCPAALRVFLAASANPIKDSDMANVTSTIRSYSIL